MQGMGGMNMDGMGNTQDNTGMDNAQMMPLGSSRLETLLTVIAPANPKPLPLPTSLAPVERLDPSKAVVTRRFELGERMMQAEFFINNQMFDINRVDVQGKLDTLEVW